MVFNAKSNHFRKKKYASYELWHCDDKAGIREFAILHIVYILVYSFDLRTTNEDSRYNNSFCYNLQNA